jgi:hypothetical protein
MNADSWSAPFVSGMVFGTLSAANSVQLSVSLFIGKDEVIEVYDLPCVG